MTTMNVMNSHEETIPHEMGEEMGGERQAEISFGFGDENILAEKSPYNFRYLMLGICPWAMSCSMIFGFLVFLYFVLKLVFVILRSSYGSSCNPEVF